MTKKLAKLSGQSCDSHEALAAGGRDPWRGDKRGPTGKNLLGEELEADAKNQTYNTLARIAEEAGASDVVLRKNTAGGFARERIIRTFDETTGKTVVVRQRENLTKGGNGEMLVTSVSQKVLLSESPFTEFERVSKLPGAFTWQDGKRIHSPVFGWCRRVRVLFDEEGQTLLFEGYRSALYRESILESRILPCDDGNASPKAERLRKEYQERTAK